MPSPENIHRVPEIPQPESVLLYVGLNKNEVPRRLFDRREEKLKQKLQETVAKAGFVLVPHIRPMEFGSVLRRDLHIDQSTKEMLGKVNRNVQDLYVVMATANIPFKDFTEEKRKEIEAAANIYDITLNSPQERRKQ